MWFPSCSSFSEFAPRPAALPGTADHCKAKSLRADRSWQDPQDSPIISHINFREWARWVRKYIVELLIDLPFTQKPRVFSVMQLYIIVYRITYMYIIIITNYAYTLSIHITWYHMYIMCICVGSWLVCCFFMQSCLPFLPAGVRALTGLGAAFGSTARPLAPAESGSNLKDLKKDGSRCLYVVMCVYFNGLICWYINLCFSNICNTYCDILRYIHIHTHITFFFLKNHRLCIHV